MDCAIAFDPAFNVIFGDNEAGKSTLSSAILAMLYGLGRGEKERWRPWSSPNFSARLNYTLQDGRTIEVQREFELDSKGVRVYDGNGCDASGEASIGKNIIPGEAHLGLPSEVFTNTSFLMQGNGLIDGSRAERITFSLARALDGGPREDAALGALGRLDAALARHVGSKRATVNAPLRHLLQEIIEAENRAAAMREQCVAVDDLRARLAAERTRMAELGARIRQQEARSRAFRAFALRSRLESLRDVRDDLAALSAERSQFDDVNGLSQRVIRDIETLYTNWHTTSALMQAQTQEAQRRRMTPALITELEERNADGGALDDESFMRLRHNATIAMTARDGSAEAADRAQAARRNMSGNAELYGALLTAGTLVAAAAAVLLSFGLRMYAAACGVLAIVLTSTALYRWNTRRATLRIAREAQREADVAAAQESAAASAVAAVLTPLGVTSVEELARRRERAVQLRERRDDAARLAAEASATAFQADEAGRAFDALIASVVVPSGSRSVDLDAVRELQARKVTRDGVDLRLSMLDVRRGDLLGSDDEYALEAELNELLRAGIEPQAPPNGESSRSVEAIYGDLVRRASETQRLIAKLETELYVCEIGIEDLAALDEDTATLKARVATLEAFEAAIELARATIDFRTKEAHQRFARRLSDYASRTLSDVTCSRYVDVRVDPTTLAVRVRTPENDAIVDVSRLSAGTREQAYLVTRLAMSQMFSEGAEATPILLDDPFAFWDDKRIERSLPILVAFVRSGIQLTIFTTSRTLADTAEQHGAKRTNLHVGQPELIRH